MRSEKLLWQPKVARALAGIIQLVVGDGAWPLTASKRHSLEPQVRQSGGGVGSSYRSLAPSLLWSLRNNLFELPLAEELG